MAANLLPLRVAVVIVNWRNAQLTCSCLESLFSLNDLQDAAIEINFVVCDNHSEDGSVDEVEAFLKNHPNMSVDVIETSMNGGFAYGSNYAFMHVIRNNCPDYIWLLNNDTKVHPGALSALLKSSQQEPNVSVWGSKVTSKGKCSSCYDFNLLNGRVRSISISEYKLKRKLLSKTKYPYVSGAALFFPISTITTFGLLNQDYFLYHEELDYMHRVGGSKQMDICLESEVLHLQGQSTSSGSAEKSQLEEYHENLSLFKYVRRHHGAWFIYLIVFKLATKPFALVLRGRLYLAPVFFKAIRDTFAQVF